MKRERERDLSGAAREGRSRGADAWALSPQHRTTHRNSAQLGVGAAGDGFQIPTVDRHI